MNTVWGLHSTNIIDTAPSMHPRGRTYSDGSESDDQDGEALYTVSSYIDRPPKYEEALINSRPINSIYYLPEKQAVSQSARKPTCCRHPGQVVQPPLEGDSNPFCRCCFDELVYDVVGRKVSTGNSMAQFALNLKRGVGSSVDQMLGRRRISHEQQQQQQQPDSNMRTRSQPAYQSDSNSSIRANQQYADLNYQQNRPRKISFCQLDVGQLMQCGSPPKYSEISMLHPEVESVQTEEACRDEPRSSRQL